jgi:hypothetical protein
VEFATVYSSATRVLTARRHVYTSVSRLSTSRQNNDVLLMWISNGLTIRVASCVRSPVHTNRARVLFSCDDRTRNGVLNTAQPLSGTDVMICLLALRSIVYYMRQVNKSFEVSSDVCTLKPLEAYTLFIPYEPSVVQLPFGARDKW